MLQTKKKIKACLIRAYMMSKQIESNVTTAPYASRSVPEKGHYETQGGYSLEIVMAVAGNPEILEKSENPWKYSSEHLVGAKSSDLVIGGSASSPTRQGKVTHDPDVENVSDEMFGLSFHTKISEELNATRSILCEKNSDKFYHKARKKVRKHLGVLEYKVADRLLGRKLRSKMISMKKRCEKKVTRCKLIQAYKSYGMSFRNLGFIARPRDRKEIKQDRLRKKAINEAGIKNGFHTFVLGTQSLELSHCVEQRRNSDSPWEKDIDNDDVGYFKPTQVSFELDGAQIQNTVSEHTLKYKFSDIKFARRNFGVYGGDEFKQSFDPGGFICVSYCEDELIIIIGRIFVVGMALASSLLHIREVSSPRIIEALVGTHGFIITVGHYFTVSSMNVIEVKGFSRLFLDNHVWKPGAVLIGKDKSKWIGVGAGNNCLFDPKVKSTHKETTYKSEVLLLLLSAPIIVEWPAVGLKIDKNSEVVSILTYGLGSNKGSENEQKQKAPSGHSASKTAITGAITGDYSEETAPHYQQRGWYVWDPGLALDNDIDTLAVIAVLVELDPTHVLKWFLDARETWDLQKWKICTRAVAGHVCSVPGVVTSVLQATQSSNAEPKQAHFQKNSELESALKPSQEEDEGTKASDLYNLEDKVA